MEYIIENNIKLDNNKKVDFEIKSEEFDLLKLKSNNFSNSMILKNNENFVSWIQIINTKGKLEINYETNKKYQNQGYMHLLLNEFLKYMKKETSEEKIYALITINSTSEKILNDIGFIYENKDEFGKWYVYNLK